MNDVHPDHAEIDSLDQLNLFLSTGSSFNGFVDPWDDDESEDT